MPRLYVLSGDNLGSAHEIVDGTVLGRSNESDVVLIGRSISRRHARFEQREGTWFVADLGSSNGTLVRGKRVESAALVDGEEFRVGDVELRFRIEDVARPRPAPAEEREPVPVAPAAPTPAPATRTDTAEGDTDGGGVELEGDWDDDVAAPSAPAAAPGSPANPPTTRIRRKSTDDAAQRRLEALGGAGAVAGERSTASGKRVLQYHRVENRSGVMSADIGQQSMLVRWLIYVLVAAVFVGLVWGVYHLTVSARGQ